MASLWGGRFEKEMDDIVKKFNASIGFDKRMYNEDIDGSIAHVTMLGEQGIVTEEEAKQIIAGLEGIREKIRTGEIEFDVDDEDIHMGIESRLIEEIGDVGKKLHTARSRNDQCQSGGSSVLSGTCNFGQSRKICGFYYRRLYPYSACAADYYRIHLYGIFSDVQKGYRKTVRYL